MGSYEKLLESYGLDDFEKKYLPYAWHLLEGDVSGSLPVAQLGIILRAFGKNPSEQEVQYLKYDNGLTDTNRLLFDDVLLLYMKCKSDVDSPSKMAEAFKVFDRDDTGYILANELRGVLTRLGEPITESDVAEMLSLVRPSSAGHVKYGELCQHLMSDNRPFPKNL